MLLNVAPVTQNACHAKRGRSPPSDNRAAAQPATIRAAGPSGGSGYRACHAKRSRAPATPRPKRRQSAQQLLQDTLATAPATQRAAAPQAATYPRSSSFKRLWTLRLQRKEEPRPKRRQSVQQLLQEALATAPATEKRHELCVNVCEMSV